MTSEHKLIIWLFGFCVFAVLLYLLSSVLMPFVAGMAVAYFLDPVADRLEKIGCSRGVATLLIIATFFIVAFGGLILLFPLLQSQVVGLISKIPALIDILRVQAEPLLQRLQADLSPQTVERLHAAAGDYAADMIRWATHMLAKMWSGGVAFLQLLSLIVITPVVAFYLLRDWDIIIEHLDGWLPQESAPVIRQQMLKIDQTIAGFVRGQSTVCLFLAVFYAIGLTILGLQFGLLVGLGAGFISFIPYVGASVGFLVGIGIALAQFPELLPIVLVAAVFIVGHVIESYFLTPKLVGEKVGLHPVWIIFAMLAGGALFGFTGVLLAIPVTAVIGVLTRFGIESYLESDLYLDEDKA